MSTLIRRADGSIGAVLWDIDDLAEADAAAAALGEAEGYTLEPLPRDPFDGPDGRAWAPSATLITDREQIPADGVTAATMTYLAGAERPAAVAFAVNGAVQDVTLTEGQAQLEVVAADAGPIEVGCEGLTLILEAI